MKYDTKAEAAFPALKELGDALRAFDADRRDPNLSWYDDTDLPFGWTMVVGYHAEWEGSSVVQVFIHEIELHAGSQVVRLSESDIEPEQLRLYERGLARREEERAREANPEPYDASADHAYEAWKERQMFGGER